MTEPHRYHRDGDPEGQFVPDQRRESWFGRNAMAVLSVIVGLGGGVLGSWVTTQVRETKTESALEQIKGTVSELKGSMDSMSKTVNAAAVASGKAQSDMDHMSEEIRKEADARGELGARTISNEKDIAYLKAVVGLKTK